ncbi:MAG: SAM-dependent methyltransferase, partial [Planctomycetes bacterium]|nr:SAM-dependent methyltransferase [Planctomycetota bacterium]
MKATVFGLSAAVLLHEICLLRVLSIAYWHHAAALVVSVALLGFGVAGTVLALAPRLKEPSVVPLCAVLYALLVAPSLLAARAVDFNILEVGWEPMQWLRLLALEAIFLVPFLVAATGINVALALAAERPGPTYAANLLGSGAGALAAPLLLALGPQAGVLRYAAAL